MERMEKLLEEGAIEALREACTARQKPETEALALFYLGEASLQEGRQEQARKYYLDACHLFRLEGKDEATAAALCRLGALALERGALAEAEQYLAETESLARQGGFSRILYYASYYQALLHSEDPPLAIQHLKQALAQARSLQSAPMAKSIYEQLHTQYRYKGQVDSAIFYYQQLIGTKQELGDSLELIGDFTALGTLYETTGNYSLAQAEFIRALRLAEAAQDSISIASLFTKLGEVYLAQRDWSSARQYIQRALQMAGRKKLPGAEAQNLNNMGELLYQQRAYKQAQHYYQQALLLYQQLNNPLNAADAQIRLLELQEITSIPSPVSAGQAARILKDALAIRERIRDRGNILRCRQALARLYIQEQVFSEAIPLLESCLALSREMKNPGSLGASYRLMARAHAGEGRYQKAYYYLQQHNALSDSLLSAGHAQIIHELELKYEAEKKDKAIAEQAVKEEQLEARIRIRNYQLLVLIIGAVLASMLAGLSYFLYRNNRALHLQKLQLIRKAQETQRLQAIIEGEEKERKRVASELHDGLGAVLATAKMQVSTLPCLLPQVEQLSSFSKAKALIDDACRSVREISHNLTPDILEQNGLDYALQYTCDSFARAHQIEVDFISYGLDTELPAPISLTVYRITQELLKNTLAHAQATAILVQAIVEDGQLNLVVEDNGKGLDPEMLNQQEGIGLSNIRHRLSQAGGQLQIDSRPGEGTAFTIDIPLSITQNIPL